MLAALTDYLAHHPGLRPVSEHQLSLAVRDLSAWMDRPPTLADLTPDTLSGYLRHHLATHSPATTNTRRQSILCLWRWANGRGLVQCPAPNIPKLREPRRIPTAWTIDEIERLVATARQWPGSVGTVPARLYWPSLFLACYDTGCRVTALRSARSCHLSLAERSLIIEPEETKTGVGCVYWLHDQTVASIAGHYDAARELVWPWPHCRRYFWTVARKIVEAAGLTADKRGMSLFHKVRRTCISYCAAVSPALAQQQAGHADPRTTARSYIDPRIARQSSAVDVLPRPKL